MSTHSALVQKRFTICINPELFRPWLFLRGLTVEEQDVGLHTLRVKDAGGHTHRFYRVLANSSGQEKLNDSNHFIPINPTGMRMS